MRARIHLGLAVALASLLSAAPAAADRVSAPPSDCPRGAVPRTSHAGPTCEPSTCDSDEACAQVRLQPGTDVAGAVVCQPQVALCVREEHYLLNTYRVRNVPQTRNVADGPCIDGHCPRGGECITASRCVHADTERDTEREAEPETAEPETAEPETAEPETAEPGTAETAEPETAEPRAGAPRGTAADGSGGCTVGRSGSRPCAASLLALCALASASRRRRWSRSVAKETPA